MSHPIEPGDLNEVLSGVGARWSNLQGARIFLTGATGFFGAWLIESFLHANRELGLNASITALSRDPESFLGRLPHLRGSAALRFVRGDVRTFVHDGAPITHFIHGATAASQSLNEGNPLEMFDTIVWGTRRALDLAVAQRCERFLLTSSGAVYGRQPPTVSHIEESHPTGPDPTSPRSAYAEGKRAAEQLAALYTAQHGLATVMARGFAFVGPHLPLDAHFAIGNFIRDGLSRQPIRVAGDGTPLRSYLYASDLATWLWTLLIQGDSGAAYNVGSDSAVTIGDLARLCGMIFSVPVTIGQTPRSGVASERYVPSSERAFRQFGVYASVGLRDAIERTAAWHRQPSTGT